MVTELIISGACGRVGREIARIALDDPAVSLVGCLDRADHPEQGRDMGGLLGRPACGVGVCASLRDLPLSGRVVVDFSTPQSLDALLAEVAGTCGALVIGTTGVDPAGSGRIRECASRVPVVYSPNMSLGVNLLFHLTEMAAARLGSSFDIEIIEAHHRYKKDSPSGTARRLGEIAAQAIGRSYDQAMRHGRNGMVGERTKTEIGMHAVRGGDIVGDHTVLFAGDGERLELKHTAHSRATFARGAVAAAKWVVAQPAGLYTMRDVLGLA